VVASVASETNQAPPDETYATLEANAAVTQVGGVLRGRGRRVLIVGLPLVRILTVDELRSVLAHEFGHYAGGDTRLGQWTYRTRAAIERTIVSLHDEDSWGMRMVQRPFIWYGNAFLRITNAISRRQEFAADAWAVRVAGIDAHVSALRKLHRLGPAYAAYWAQEVTPVLDAGAQPPVGAGFTRFVTVPHVREACDAQLAEALEEGRSDPYSSHPTLPERLEALGEAPARESAGGDPAIDQIHDSEGLERRILDKLASDAGVGALEPVAWDDVGARVYRRRYDEMLAEHRRVIEGVTIASLPEAVADPGAIARRAFGAGVRDDTHPLVFATLGAGLAVALAEQGWKIDAGLAEPLVCRRGEAVIEPFGVVEEMVGGELRADAWTERMDSLGIEDAPLGAAPAPVPG
jgi:heat shock protein HtpX